MQIPKECLVIDNLKDRRGHLTGIVSIGLKNADGEVVLKAAGESKAGAELHLLTKLQHMATNINLFGAPQLITFRGTTIILYLTRDGYWTWSRVHVGVPPYLGGCTIYASYDETDRAARVALAWEHWDKQEETSPIIYHPEDRAKFTKDAQRAKKQNQLVAQGWEFQEANYILDGLRHLISDARFAAMPPIPESIHS